MTTESKTPDRYRHPSGVECWQISCHLPHPLASAFEYVWRHRQKGGVEDLQKALRWLELEENRRRIEWAGRAGGDAWQLMRNASRFETGGKMRACCKIFNVADCIDVEEFDDAMESARKAIKSLIEEYEQ